jgi:hypothetical protein
VEKWAILYATGGSRYDVMMSNLAELNNMIMRGVRILSFVGIVEFILYGCTNYFMKRHDATSLALLNLALVYGDVITKYMTNKIIEAIKHVKSMGTINLRFEVLCNDKLRRGVGRESVVQ